MLVFLHGDSMILLQKLKNVSFNHYMLYKEI